jgi:carboxylesterase type B
MSGTSLAEWSIERKPLDTLTKLGAFLECDITNSTTIKTCLMDTEWPYIAQAHFYVMLGDQLGNLKAVLPGASVVIEGDIPGAFLTDEPLKLLESGDIPDVPILLGATQHEGSFLLGIAYVLKLEPTGLLNDTVYVRDHLIGDLLSTWDIDENKNGGSISQGLSLAYLPGNPRTNFSSFTYELIDMLSSLFMKAPVLRTADILSRRNSAVYLYSFEYYGDNSLWTTIFAVIEELFGDLLPIPEFSGGIMHADDIPYMFTMPLNVTERDATFSRMFCQLFTNFATNGTPTPAATPDYPVWPPYTVDEQKYMELSLTPVVKTDYSSAWRKGVPGAN